MRFVEADLDRTRITMPNRWSLVKDPEAFWGDLGTQGRLLLKELLEGQGLQLITTDSGGGLIAAVQDVYRFVARQRGWFHKRQNGATKVRRKDQTRVLCGLRPVYPAANRRAAERAALAWAGLWRERYPDAVACVAQDLTELPAFYDVPEPHRRRVRTTNPIESRRAGIPGSPAANGFDRDLCE